MAARIPTLHTLASANDALLSGFLEADDPARSDDALRDLVEQKADPIIKRLLLQKNRMSARANPARGNSDDIASAARELLVVQLLALRAGERETPITDFRAYVASVAYSAWAQHLRNENPQRSMLLNRIRYLLENRTRLAGFALWESTGGRKWCGYPRWQTETEPDATAKLERLLADPAAIAREAFGDRYWQRDDLGALVVGLFTWLERPIELRDLVFVVSELLEISDRTDTLESNDENAAEEISGRSPSSPVDDLAWKEYLHWLWGQIGSLSPNQSAAFLLHSEVLREFELVGLASIRSVAPRIGLDPERLAEFWQQLPIADLIIAEHLGCTRQQVINLRRVARDSLGAAWAQWTTKTTSAGNKGAVSASST